MSALITLHNLTELLQKPGARLQGEHPIVPGLLDQGATAVLKFQQESASEVLGYQLAHAIAAPVPGHRGFWSPDSVKTPRIQAPPGRIGILVEYLSDYREISREEAAKRDPEGLSRILAVCVFDRHEWGECGLVDDKLVFVDLERLFPGLIPELVDAPDVDNGYIHRCLDDYVRTSGGLAAGALDEAKRLGVHELTMMHLQTLETVLSEQSENLFALDPHPLAEQIVDVTVTGLRMRLNCALQL